MSDGTVLRASQIFLCVVASTALGACGTESASALEVEPVFNIAACTAAQAGGGWVNRPFVAQPSTFDVEFVATPSASPIDAVVGLSRGAATTFTALAAIVRFNPAGTIDVRSGSTYVADTRLAYAAGTAYHFHLEIDVTAHIYSVFIDTGGQPIGLARGYSFRTEQAQVGQLDNLAIEVDSAGGRLQVCGLRITPIDAAGCPIAEAGLGFLDHSVGHPGSVVVSSEFIAKPDRVLDGVIGLSESGAVSFDDLAATVRLSPDGVIDARDGERYRADVGVAYAAGQPQRIRIVANVPLRTFSVYVANDSQPSVQLAHDYAFRTTQSTATFLGNLDAVIDSTSGALSMCNMIDMISIGVRLAREGNYAVAPLPGNTNEALMSTATTTLHLGANGSVRAQIAAGGLVAVDPAGQVYLARITGSDLVVEAYTAGLALRWSRSFPAGAGHRALAIGSDGTSVVAAAGPVGGGVDLVKRWLVDGTESTTATGPMADVVAIGPGGYALGSAINGTVAVSKWTFGRGTPDWTRSWQNSAHIDAIALTPGGGVGFAGTFSGPASFGGPTITPIAPGGVFVAALSASGDHVFTRSLASIAVRGLGANGPVIAVSTLRLPGVPELINLDSQGQTIFNEEGRTGFGSDGDAGTVAVGPSGRVYWNFAEAWPRGSAQLYPYLIALDPGV
jgi:hypothetical protein